MPESDEPEAKRLLFNAHAEARPLEYSDKRDKAAKALLSTVMGLANKAGFRVNGSDPAKGVVAIGFQNASSDEIRLTADHEGVELAFIKPPVRKPSRIPKIKYEPASDRWEGTDPEIFVTPVAGEPTDRRRSAAAVVAEAIAKALTGADSQ